MVEALLPAVCLILVVGGLAYVWIRRRRTMALALMESRAGNDEVMTSLANLSFLRHGWSGIGGTGILRLTSDRLWFCMWCSRKIWSIELSQVTSVEHFRNGYAGRSGRNLIGVLWAQEGRENIAVWHVKDAPRWVAAVDDCRLGRGRD